LGGRKFILEQLHSMSMAGHLGQNKTLSRVRQRCYWPGMRQDVFRWVTKCHICDRVKALTPRGKAELRQSEVTYTMERVAIDLMGPMPMTRRGNQHILVVVDYGSKWAEAFAIPDQSAITVADALMSEFFCRYGVPYQLHSDQGTSFQSQMFRRLMTHMGISQTRTTPYRPQSDGLVERCNRTIKQMLTSMLQDNDRDEWDDLLPYAMAAYRSAVHETTGCTPNRIMLAREVALPVDLMFPIPHHKDKR
jgi:hypothetical protein